MRHFSGELDGIRLLMADELEKVAGGDADDGDDVPETELPDVIVTAQSPVHTAIYNGLIGLATGIIGTVAGNSITNAQQSESNIAKTFNPTDVTTNITGWDVNGNIIHGWQTKDGSTWWDNNRNNVPDQRMWTDPAGNVWSDWGSGPQLVKGAS